MTAAPEFSWLPDGGLDNVFAVDMGSAPDFSTYYSIFEDLNIQISETSWTMPDSVWNMIPGQTTVHWRVRGADLGAGHFDIITSEEIRSFVKE